MKKTVKLLSLLLVVCMLLGSCAQSVGEGASMLNDAKDANVVLDNGGTENVSAGQSEVPTTNEVVPEKGTYNEGVALVKYDGEMNDNVLSQLGLVSATALYSGSAWYTVELASGADTVETVNYLRELACFEKVDYDYIMGTTGPKEDAEQNPGYEDQVNLGLSNIPNGWTKNGKAPGGSPDVIVAVIDTGVDYNHLDLRNNIWVNSAEIPDNGKDDDGNGYVDDVYGWNFVGNNKNPMDDNGHGTHVAGIIAAENNKEGGIGVAYNCKVMVLKAGNSSGYFNNSDIAKAIQYAYMNGASVINMSFGGSNISLAVEEALENAYNTSVLVAAAGNDGACNDLSCKECDKVGVSYPAALPYVIGVMSVDKDGKHSSTFSNYDHNPYDSIEYEVYAVGEGVGSTWPSNKYACLNGTSMAAPTVAGIAALLRSYYSDREVYSTKFIQSQIVNTGTVYPHMSLVGGGHVTDEAHSVADVVEALTKLPKPAANLYDYYIDDSTSISNKNNGNGVIDAGETVRLYISLHNRGGVASNVNVSIDTDRGMGMTDPYFTFVNPTMQISDIGTYSVRESGDKYFEIVVDGECPNDYLVNFNIRFTYTNGLDTEDKATYSGDGEARFNVSRGYHLPSVIDVDTVFTNDRLYIVGENVTITTGVTVTFEEGCHIQFYDDRDYYDSPRLFVYGTLSMQGATDDMILINPSERYSTFECFIENRGTILFNYVNGVNVNIKNSVANAESNIYNSYLFKSTDKDKYTHYYTGGRKDTTTSLTPVVSGIYNSYVEINVYGQGFEASIMDGNFIKIAVGNANDLLCRSDFTNNTVYSERLANNRVGCVDMYGISENNIFLNDNKRDLSIIRLNFSNKSLASNNKFSLAYRQYISQVIDDYYDISGNPTVNVNGSLINSSLLYPQVVNIEIFDKDGTPITTVGREEIKVRVTFNRPMDVNAGTFLTFGTIEPYGDYRIDGEYISDTVWEGTYTLKAQIENGQNFLKVNNACAADDPTKVVFGEYQLHEFTIDTTAAMSMNLQAVAKDNGIELTFAQDDYDTLLGYNIYRATSKDGNYVRLNPAILLPSDSMFLDENAEPGKTYWYTYTVVLTDFSESNPAGKVQATAMDTLAPNMYHTPVNQGYMNNNLVISCTATDNMAIATVTLYYRTVGATEWKTLNMAKQSDKYSATIFGSELTLDGIEYYIIATDGRNTIKKGSAEAPYTVIVKDASAISRKGDVDGDGVVTTKDALMLMQCINGDLILSDDEFKRADLNGDNVLNSSEALRILQYINGNVSTLTM